MTALLLALLGGLGVFYCYTAVAFGWRHLTPGPRAVTTAGSGGRRTRPGIEEWLAQAGLHDIDRAEFAAAVALLGMTGAAVGYVLFAGVVAAALLGAFAATLPVASFRLRRQRRLARAHEAWPQLIEEIRILTSAAGRSVPVAVFDVGRRAPDELRPAFAAAEREWRITTDFERTLAVLKDHLADASADVVCETLLVAHELGGTDLDRRLDALVTDRIDDVQGRKDAVARQAGVRFARWFTLAVPIGMALVGMSIGDGRAAYGQGWGQALVALALSCMIGCWVWAGRIMALPEPQRAAGPATGRSMNARLLIASGIALWIGAALLFTPLRWFRRPPLVERLRPYTPTGMTAPVRRGVFSAASVGDIVGPLSTAVGGALARFFGVSEELAVRLRRIHSPSTSQAFARQLGWSIVAMATATIAAVTLALGPLGATILLLAAPLLTFLTLEQRVATASAGRQRRLFLELPVVAEQLGMLLSAGWSLGAALQRIARRGHGAAAEDLRIVSARVRSGLGETDALREWAELADIDALHRLVAVLALNRDATDLGTLISQEARAIRRDVHRELLEAIERKSQQVWIPVTVAALVPGAILIAIPFIHAMRTFANA